MDRIADILRQVRSPLGFFTAASLTGGASIMAVAATDLESYHKLIAIGIVAFLFLVLVGMVAWISFFRPRNLQEDITTLQDILESAGFKDTVEDLILDRIKPDCLTTRSGSQEGDSR